MALYRPDHKLKEAKDYIDNLDDSKENELIKYYIQKKDKLIEKQNIKLNAYYDWFNKLDSFLPNKNMKF